MVRTNITKTFMELFQSPHKTFYSINTQVLFSFTDSTNRCKAIHVILNLSDAESFWGLWKSSMEFLVITKLLIKELWFRLAQISPAEWNKRWTQTFKPNIWKPNMFFFLYRIYLFLYSSFENALCVRTGFQSERVLNILVTSGMKTQFYT